MKASYTLRGFTGSTLLIIFSTLAGFSRSAANLSAHTFLFELHDNTSERKNGGDPKGNPRPSHGAKSARGDEDDRGIDKCDKSESGSHEKNDKSEKTGNPRSISSDRDSNGVER